MSEFYNFIPPERQIAYLQNASEAVRQATDPVLEDIVKITFFSLVDLTPLKGETAREAAVVEDAKNEILKHAIIVKLIDSIDEPQNSVTAAEQYLLSLDLMGLVSKNHFSLETLRPSTVELLRGSGVDLSKYLDRGTQSPTENLGN